MREALQTMWNQHHLYWRFIYWETCINFEDIANAQESLQQAFANSYIMEINAWSERYGTKTPRYFTFYAGWYAILAPFILVGKILDWTIFQENDMTNVEHWLNPDQHYGVFSWAALFIGAIPAATLGLTLAASWYVLAYTSAALLTTACSVLTLAAIPLRIALAPFHLLYAAGKKLGECLFPSAPSAANTQLAESSQSETQLSDSKESNSRSVSESKNSTVEWYQDPVDFEDFTKPVVLDACGHTIDQRTVNRLTKNECPLDHQRFNLAKLKTNWSLLWAINARKQDLAKSPQPTAIATPPADAIESSSSLSSVSAMS